MAIAEPDPGEIIVAMNEVYATRFTGRPAKTTVEFARLDKGTLIEIEAIAGL